MRKEHLQGQLKIRRAWVEVAEKGTLFVDEIGDMKGDVQAKILSLLDSGLFRRLGETKERKADVKIIAATNHDLEKEIKELEIAYIKKVLKKEKDNRTRSAKILGISRSTLKKKIADNPSLRKIAG